MIAGEIGIVVIGRNEGERLKRCLQTVVNRGYDIVYVDSGSTDDSVHYVRKSGVYTLELDMRTPFSAARARNAGFTKLTEISPQVDLVQFIDGDCELSAGWIDLARDYLRGNPQCAMVAGRTIEKYPEKSIYNLLCDLEWNTPAGKVKSCGGIFMIQKQCFLSTGGFNPSITAGEEPEMCYRLRKTGWEIHRLDYPMAFHDASITRFSQWWRRAVRGGHSFAQGYILHKGDKGSFCLRDSIRIWLWGLAVPLATISTVLAFGPGGIWLLAVYPAQLFKITIKANRRFRNLKFSLLYAFFNIIGKWPQLYGQLKFITQKLFHRTPVIIEYK